MTVEELIADLQKWPGHFTVQALLVNPECDDEPADFVGVKNEACEKIVSLELDGRPS